MDPLYKVFGKWNNKPNMFIINTSECDFVIFPPTGGGGGIDEEDLSQ